jgi:Protein of unknown function (DUF1153)
MLQEATAEESQNSESDVWGSLPTQGNVRWTPWRKRDVVIALRNGAITAFEAIERYRLSREELADWIEGFERYGVAGLHLKRKRWAPTIAARANRARAM